MTRPTLPKIHRKITSPLAELHAVGAYPPLIVIMERSCILRFTPSSTHFLYVFPYALEKYPRYPARYPFRSFCFKRPSLKNGKERRCGWQSSPFSARSQTCSTRSADSMLRASTKVNMPQRTDTEQGSRFFAPSSTCRARAAHGKDLKRLEKTSQKKKKEEKRTSCLEVRPCAAGRSQPPGCVPRGDVGGPMPQRDALPQRCQSARGLPKEAAATASSSLSRLLSRLRPRLRLRL